MSRGFAPQIKPKKKEHSSQLQELKPIEEVQENLLSYIDHIQDPRVARTQKHLLKDIIIIGILAIIGGGEGWEDMENYGISKLSWLQEFLSLPNGIPSDDTFRRVFERINPLELEQVLTKWLTLLIGSLNREVVPIDGKCLRGSYDRDKGVKALNLVTAWASEQRLMLGQIKVEDKSNEITAIPALLELIDITGAIVTIDAMGTQIDIVKNIQEKKADYVLALKGNHPTLYTQVKEWFSQHRAKGFEDKTLTYDERIEKGHHRTEKRRVWAIPLEAFGGLYKQEKWVGLQTIVVVERIRHLWNKTTMELQFYLSSLPPDARVNGRVIRQHWTIENQLHWTLDVTFNEDHCRVRSGNSPRNLAFLRPLALNALNQEKTLKRSLRQKRKRAAMNNDYMITVLSSFCQG